MNSILRLFNSFSVLADALSGLASTISRANKALEEKLGEQQQQPLLPEHVDHTRNGYLPAPQEQPPEQPRPRNGRGKGKGEPEQASLPTV